MTNRFHGTVAANYLSERIGTTGWETEHAAMLELMRSVPAGGRVLDVPFGTGRFVELFKSKEMAISGVDSSPDMLQAARQAMGEDNFAQCDLRVAGADKMPFDDNTFDLIVCCRFLTGIATYDLACRTLAEFRRLCRARAILFLRNRIDGAPPLKKQPTGTEKIASRFTHPQIVDLLNRYGFGVVQEVTIPTGAVDALGEKRAYLVAV